MFWTVLALVMTVIMGGIIAYYGDLIGRKYGKKRLSMFGLRPKYTAILITSVSGVAISAITIAVLFLLVPPVRDIILDGENAIRQTKDLNKKIQVNKAQLDDVNNKRQHAEKQYAEMQGRVRPMQVQVTSLAKQLAGERKQLELVKSERDRARQLESEARVRYRELIAKNTDLKTSNSKLTASNATLLTKNENLTGINLALATKIQSLNGEKSRLEAYNSDYTKQNEELAQQNERSIRERENLAKQLGELSTKRTELAERTKELSDYNAKLEEKNAGLADSNKKLAAQNAELNEFFQKIAPGYKSLREAYFASRNKRVVVHKDEDLARLVIPALSSPEDIRKRIEQDLMFNANQSALAKGATAGNQARAVQLVDHQIITRSDGVPDETTVTGEDRIDALVRRLAWQSSPMCVVAVAATNSVEDEPASIDLVPFANKGIYNKGQEVAVHRLNAGLPADKLFENVVTFLRGLGLNALQQGMIPRMDSSGEPQVGSLSAAEIARLVEQVREYNGMVRIRAIAASNIHSADPLALTFKVEP